MASSKVTVIRKVVTFILAVCVDLSLFYATGCVATQSVFGHLTRLWVSAALRCLALIVLTLLSLGELKPLLIRVVTAHSVLPAVFETGSKALYHEWTQCGFLADMRCWLVCAGASLAAALFWEIILPDTDEKDEQKQTKQESRKLFVRVLYLHKPLYRLLTGGLLFLSLAVLCK